MNSRGSKIIIGIDEVGRGPIAGPVCVAAFLVYEPVTFAREIKKITTGKNKDGQKLPLRDSKKLSRHNREAWVSIVSEWKKAGKCDFAISITHAEKIDQIGIAKAIRKSLASSLEKVSKNISLKTINNRSNKKNSATHSAMTDIKILLDGGLRAPVEYTNQKTIIKGDEKKFAIALASIVAKVHRDKHMYRLAKLYPKYGFESHVGYGTKAHYLAIKKHGITGIHRKSFLGKVLGAVAK